MATRSQSPDPAYLAKRDQYERLTSSLVGVECKCDANRYTSVNGHMFSYLHPSGAMALRLPAAERQAFLRDHQTTLFQAYGVVQKEYVAVPDALLADTARLRPLLQLSYDYVQALKPKPTTKTRK